MIQSLQEKGRWPRVRSAVVKSKLNQRQKQDPITPLRLSPYQVFNHLLSNNLPSLLKQAGAFQFITEQDAFKGYAGFWKRFAAFIIDGLILMVCGFIIGGFIDLVHEFTTGTSAGAGALGNLGGIILGWLYFAIMESSSTQGTLGKMALAIKVTNLSGNRISFGRATGRHFGKIISAFILLIGYLMVAFTSRKQGLHDMMAGCLVVKRR